MRILVALDASQAPASITNTGALSCASCSTLPITIGRISTSTIADTYGTLLCQGTY